MTFVFKREGAGWYAYLYSRILMNAGVSKREANDAAFKRYPYAKKIAQGGFNAPPELAALAALSTSEAATGPGEIRPAGKAITAQLNPSWTL